ncbi:hypothetical protein [Mycobacterium sp. 48b]|uniref:hypothetical protein n=1 Tax=Mycobacterium sp. 48b TaxID=3400426 RepID=UPI003AAEFD51
MATRTFHGVVTTPSGTPLGGWVDVEVSDNGDYHVKFHMHSSSILGDFDFNLRAYLTAPGFPTMAFIKSGHVSGVDSWNHEERGHSPLLALYWSKLDDQATYGVAKEYKWGGVVGTLTELVGDILDVAAGAVGGALGVVIGATREAIDWMGATLGPGGTLGVIGGVVVFAVSAVAGAGIGTALILGVVAGVAIGAVTNALIKFRPLNAAEIAFARQVFGNSLPYQDVIITNLAGLGDRAFTAPGVDGKTYLNIGRAYDNPLGTGGDGYPKPGQLLIHELTHAWQIAHTGSLPGLMCSGMVNQASFILGDNVYQYGPPGRAWSEFNAEQQGAIVDQWFGGTGPSSRYKEADQENPYYRYIWNDLINHLPPDEARANLRATASSALNVVSREPLRLELFWATTGKAIGSQWWTGTAGDSWADHSPIDVVATGAAAPGAAVTTVARTPGNLDVFWVGPDGSVMTQWSAAGSDGGWTEHGGAFAIAPAGSATPGAPIAAVARTADNLDVFWVRPDGAIAGQWWAAAPGASWADHGAFNIAPPGSAEKGSSVAVVARMPDHLDVFWVTRDGGIGSNWWTAAPGTSWADHGSFRIAPAGSARPGSALSVVARTPDNLDVYWVTPDGAVASNWWFAAPGASWADHGWFTITAPGAVAAGGGITATSRTPNNLDVFWVAPDGSIGTQWWHAAVGHSWADHAPFPIAPAGAAASGSALDSVGRLPSHLDVFWVRPDGAIGTQWWDAAPDQGWNHQPFAVTPPGVAVVPPAAPAPDAVVDRLDALGVDFSVPATDLADWLQNPEFTPYPAISEALQKLLSGKHLRKPVYLDVIAFNYESTPGVPSPRRVQDVRMPVLEAAVVQGHNVRYDEAVTKFADLLVPAV